jgi:hypothetical protein
MYTIKAHPTMYAGTQFRSRLEARWACFFDLAGWTWEYEPIDLVGWSPDFYVTFPCTHADCWGGHELLVEVKPFFDVAQFKAHKVATLDPWCSPHPAMFGLNPEVTFWQMDHAGEKGVHSILEWVPRYGDLWRKAGNETQWKGPR